MNPAKEIKTSHEESLRCAIRQLLAGKRVLTLLAFAPAKLAQNRQFNFNLGTNGASSKLPVAFVFFLANPKSDMSVMAFSFKTVSPHKTQTQTYAREFRVAWGVQNTLIFQPEHRLKAE